ncbi:MAG TPA: hypothetical protein VGL51_06385 [Solirubrobacteraceae bacterium]|jgi:hypothetical protein
MEWVSHLAGEAHSDQPACVSPALRAFCVSLNDNLGQNTRQRMRPYLTRTIGTADDGLDTARAWMAADWLIRVYTPAWLDLAGASDAAQRLAVLPGVRHGRALVAALDPLKLARRDARAVLTGTLRGAPLARMLPCAAARAARKAAWASGEAAVWTMARVAAGGVLGQQARDDATAAAQDAAAAAARRARADAKAAGEQPGDQAGLQPTIERLERSSLTLLDHMLPTETLEPPTGPGSESFCSRVGSI